MTTQPPLLAVKSIHRYLPGVYAHQVVVDFECGCWAGSRSESFGYDCSLHAKQSASTAQQPR